MDLDAEAVAGAVPIGTKAEREITVAADSLAPQRGVFSTPRMIELMEGAAHLALASHMPQGWTSVGTEVCVRHLAATPPGQRVRAVAELASVDGRRLRFRVEAFNEARMIGEGTHERVVVNLGRFTENARRS